MTIRQLLDEKQLTVGYIHHIVFSLMRLEAIQIKRVMVTLEES